MGEQPDALVESSRQQVRIIREKFKTDETSSKRKEDKKLKNSDKIWLRLELNKVAKLQHKTNDVTYYRLWQSREWVDNMLRTIPANTEKVVPLKAQLRFCKEVFKQNLDDPTVYRFSMFENGKSVQLTIWELTNNVKNLIEHALSFPRVAHHQDQVIHVGQNVRHNFQNQDKESLCTGRVASQVCSSYTHSGHI